MSQEKKLTQRILLSTMNANTSVYKQNDCYWSIKDIATYIGKSESTVRRTLLQDKRFPKPLTFGKNSSKRWLSSEVKAALLLFREDDK